jgi:hypothetical protein
MSKVRLTDNSHKMIVCPGCETLHAPDDRWTFNNDLEKPTFTPSLLVKWKSKDGEMTCHSFVTNGIIQFLPDSTHKLSGQSVPLPDIDEWLREN